MSIIRQCVFSNVFCSAVPLISMLDMESRHIPQACLNYAYLLFGKGAFRETLHIRGKGTSGVNKKLILYSQKPDFLRRNTFLLDFVNVRIGAHCTQVSLSFVPKNARV